jgi:rhamnose utilization protein RhaD (predicted bifunctional aldolase and dehydrogenase)
MLDRSKILAELIELSNWLGAPQQDCAILGEGNTSARISDSTFMVKASGTELGTLNENGLVEIDFGRTMAMLADESLDDNGVRDALLGAKIDASNPRLPSVETPLHAICLELNGVNFVGHTHPTAINAITCSNQFESALEHRLFPDEVVVCGTEPLLVPYVDPGIVLARRVKEKLDAYVDRTGTAPKTIYMQNHGFIALGSSAKQVKSITAMAVKAARILIGTQSFGGPRPMDASQVTRIDTRLDEHYRQRVIENQG